MQIGFIGLGNMGLPMARNLLQAGFQVIVYNRTAEKAQVLIKEGAKLANTPADAVPSNGVVITMLANDKALEEVVFAKNGIGTVLGPKEIHISMSTVSPATISKIYVEHQKQGSQFMAAPVFGRPEAAAAKKLWICTAGAEQIKNQARNILLAMGQGIYDFGEKITAANIVKLAGNFLISSAIEAMAEAFTLAEKNGLDRKQVAEMFGQTLFACPVYQNYGKQVATQAYMPAGFKLNLGLKDINLLLQTAAEINMPMPLASLLHDRFISAMAKHREDMDWAAIALNSSEDAGVMSS